ncbi:MAG: hypothetical protein ACKO81_09785 [Planctomycetota bacterium]
MHAFAATIFLSAYLLFFVQPMIARFILPWFGGVPAVWTTCMLFFQLTLLGGYFYADWLNRRFDLRWQVLIHSSVALVGLCFLPVIPAAVWKPTSESQPVSQILGLLAATVGWPYFVLSTTGPLLQAWFAQRFPRHSPYRLYALSNFGSLLALVGYPFLIEPLIGTRLQAVSWSFGYALFTALLLGTGWSARRAAAFHRLGEQPPSGSEEIPVLRQAAFGGWWAWLTLATIPSVLLLAVTNELCQDVAVIPFLWIVPLSLYLVSFIICFEYPSCYQRPFWISLMLLSSGAVIYELFQPGITGLIFQLLAFNSCLFSAAMVCHGELARARPTVERLTQFYLAISLGGALGGVLVVFVAPLLFARYFELHWSLIAAALVGLLTLIRGTRSELAWVVRCTLLGSLLVGVSLLSNDLSTFLLHRPSQWAFGLAWLAGGGVAITWLLSREAQQATASDVEPNRTSRLVFLWAGVWGTLGLVAIAFPQLLEWALPAFLACLYGLAGGLLLTKFKVLEANHVAWINALGLVVLFVCGAGFLWVQAHVKPDGQLLRESRDFYGLVSAVEMGLPEQPRGVLRQLFSGRIVHGMQYFGEGQRRRPVSYYGAISGVGQAVTNHPRRAAGDSMRFGVIGLGAGVLAAWSNAGDTIQFFEINPRIRDYAFEFFSYLRDTAAETDVEIGDGRLLLEQTVRAKDFQPYHLLVVDAFSGDAIPRHLLTKECFELYRSAVDAEQGILALHITNGHFSLAPVVLKLAEDAGWSCVEVVGKPKSNLEDVGQEESHWVLLSRRADLLEPLKRNARGQVESTTERIIWTDDFGSPVQLLKLPLPSWWPFGGQK